jgi:hypothetical protein
MGNVKYLTLMIAIAAVAITNTHAVEIKNIAISTNVLYGTTVTLTGDNIINCYDKYYPDSSFLVLSIYDGVTKLEEGQYDVNRGSISSLRIVRKDNHILNIVIRLPRQPSYLLINTNNILELSIREQNDIVVQPWSISQPVDIVIDKEKYSLSDTIRVQWAYAGLKASVNYRYRIEGPKQWLGDSTLGNGIWSGWCAAKCGEYVKPAFAAKGRYAFTVQFSVNDTILAEARETFKIK